MTLLAEQGRSRLRKEPRPPPACPAPHPFEDGVLVGWHARPNFGRGDSGVVVRVVVALVQVLDGLFSELALQVVLPLPGVRSRLGARGDRVTRDQGRQVGSRAHNLGAPGTVASREPGV